MIQRRPSNLVFAVIAGLLVATSAHAYVDPGSGSLFLQAMLAGILGGIFAVKTYWRNLKGSLTRALHKNGDGDVR